MSSGNQWRRDVVACLPDRPPADRPARRESDYHRGPPAGALLAMSRESILLAFTQLLAVTAFAERSA
jgi:hypothetical protein